MYFCITPSSDDDVEAMNRMGVPMDVSVPLDSYLVQRYKIQDKS